MIGDRVLVAVSRIGKMSRATVYLHWDGNKVRLSWKSYARNAASEA